MANTAVLIPFGCGNAQPFADESFGARVGQQDHESETDHRADSGTGGDDARRDAVLAVCHPGGSGDEHGCEDNTVADADGDEAGNEGGVGAVWRHRQSQGLPFARQLRLHLVGLGLHEAYSLPRKSRRDSAPALTPPAIRQAQDDPRFLPAVLPGQLSLLPAPRRRLVRADRYRIAGRRWPEEVLLTAHAEAMADDAYLSKT